MVPFHGLDCTSSFEFFDLLEEKPVEQDDNVRDVTVIFDNPKGFDCMFILQHCYGMH